MLEGPAGFLWFHLKMAVLTYLSHSSTASQLHSWAAGSGCLLLLSCTRIILHTPHAHTHLAAHSESDWFFSFVCYCGRRRDLVVVGGGRRRKMKLSGRYVVGEWGSLVPRLSKSAREGEEAESLVSAVYACASFTQILGKPYSVRASSFSKTSSLVM